MPFPSISILSHCSLIIIPHHPILSELLTLSLNKSYKCKICSVYGKLYVMWFSWMISDMKMESSIYCSRECITLHQQGLVESVSEVLDNKHIFQQLIT